MADVLNEGADGARDEADVVSGGASNGPSDGADPTTTVATAEQVGIEALRDKLPPAIQSAVAKRDAEVSEGLAELADYRELEPFADRARRTGQTLAQALEAYVAIDDLVRRDPVQGLLHIAQNRGLRMDEATTLFAMLSVQLGGSSLALRADQNGQAQHINTFEQRFTPHSHEDQSQRRLAASSVLERFRSDPRHRHYDLVVPIMNDLLGSGIVRRSGDLAADLASAYESACWQHPQVREQLINERSARIEEERKAREKEAVEKARSASRSVTGSPQPGATETLHPDDDDLEAEIRRNLRAAAI